MGRAVVLAVLRDRARRRVYNVGEEPTPTIAERASRLAQAAGFGGEICIRPDAEVPPPLPLRYEQPLVYDTSRIRRELDWSETTPPEEAWRRTVAWEMRTAGWERGDER